MPRLTLVLAAFVLLQLPHGAAAQTTALAVNASTTFAGFVRDAADAYRETTGGLPVAVTNLGSLAGASGVAGGTADIAFVDTAPKNADLLSREVFALPIDLVADPKSGVASLRKSQVAELFSGGITSWKQLGGADLPVRLFIRPPANAMSAAFAAVFGHAPSAGEALATSEEVVAAVGSTPGAVGFILAGTPHANLTELAIDGHAPSGGLGPRAYPFFALGYAVTAGPPKREVSRFLAFVETRRALLAKYGIVAARDLQR